ncbi:MAG: LuxR C-terminal-related transcriptional regulator, partial [Acidimicrobiia bacterium]
KGSVTEELLLAVRSAHRGATYLTPVASDSVLDIGTQDRGSHPTDLTARELEVLHLIGEGLTNRAIGSRLSISIKTVERHRTSIMAKLDVHGIVELMREAFRLGLLDIDQ